MATSSSASTPALPRPTHFAADRGAGWHHRLETPGARGGRGPCNPTQACRPWLHCANSVRRSWDPRKRTSSNLGWVYRSRRTRPYRHTDLDQRGSVRGCLAGCCAGRVRPGSAMSRDWSRPAASEQTGCCSTSGSRRRCSAGTTPAPQAPVRPPDTPQPPTKNAEPAFANSAFSLRLRGGDSSDVPRGFFGDSLAALRIGSPHRLSA
jgi:hypothetical protein